MNRRNVDGFRQVEAVGSTPGLEKKEKTPASKRGSFAP
jgi:hypothetical protein